MSSVLLVSVRLAGRSGTEVVCCETARGLRRRGHEVSIYAQQEGPTAEQMRAEGFRVACDLSSLTQTPDVIQSSQTFPLIEVTGRFPLTPAVAICHDATIWFNEPVDLPSIRRHVAVDLACRDRIGNAIPHLAGQTEILGNAVDLDSFPPRAPLPRRPGRALLIAKQASSIDAVRDACAQRGLELSIVGPGAGHEVADLAARFCGADMVFASARSALEALAAGCAVVVLDGRGFAGLVTRANVAAWRQNNFGLRLFSRPVSAQLIADAIDRYDAADAQVVSKFIRENASLESYLDRLEALHREVIAENIEEPIDQHDLLYRMGLSISRIERAWRAEAEAYFAGETRSFYDGLHARFARQLDAREAELRTVFDQEMERRLRASEAEHRRQADRTEAELRAAFGQELQQQASRLSASEAAAQAREADLRRQVDRTEAAFAAFRLWAAPRNLPRRILHRVRRGFSGR